MLAFFHTKDAGPDAPFYRYNIMSKDTLELQLSAASACSVSSTTGTSKSLPRIRLQEFLPRRDTQEVLVSRSGSQLSLAAFSKC